MLHRPKLLALASAVVVVAAVLVVVLALKPSPSTLLDRLSKMPPSLESREWTEVLRYSEMRQLSPEEQRRMIGIAQSWYLSIPRAADRRVLLEQILSTGSTGSEVVAFGGNAARDLRPEVRQVALQLLPPSADAAAILVRVIHATSDMQTQHDSLNAIARMGPAAKGQAAALARGMGKAETATRISICVAIGAMEADADDVAEELASVYGEDVATKVAILNIVGKLGGLNDTAVAIVMRGLGDDNDRVRSAAAECAGRIVTRDLVRPEEVMRWLSAENPSIRAGAVSAVQRAGREEVFRETLLVLCNDEDAGVRAAAKEAVRGR